MSLDGIAGGYGNTYALLQAANEENALKAEAASMDLAAKDEATKEGSTALESDILSYLSKIPKGDDNKLSFAEVDEYRTGLEEKWDVEVMADLEKLGVDITQQFPLTYDPDTGKVTVTSDHPDKETIDKYFEDNPDKVEDFETIIQLGKLTSLANSKLSQDQWSQNLQMDTLAWWYADNTNTGSWFETGGMVARQGQSAYTGLNLTV